METILGSTPSVEEECSGLTGHLKEICMGISNLPRAKENQYRATKRFGNLPPLPLDKPKHKRTRPASTSTSCNKTHQSLEVGDHFELLVTSIGFINELPKTCKCRSLRRKLNKLQPAGVEREFESLVLLLKESYKSLPTKPQWTIKLCWKAIKLGFTFHVWVNPFNPIPGLLRESIWRSRHNSGKKTQPKKG